MPPLITHPVRIDVEILARTKPKDLAPPMVDIDIAASGRQRVQVEGVFSRYQTRDLKRKSLLVNAPPPGTRQQHYRNRDCRVSCQGRG